MRGKIKCKYARSKKGYQGWMCSKTKAPCRFLVPDEKVCEKGVYAIEKGE